MNFLIDGIEESTYDYLEEDTDDADDTENNTEDNGEDEEE